MTITATEAKAKLAEFLRAAEAGSRFVITRRGVPVAELGPLSEKVYKEPRAEAASNMAASRREQGVEP